MKALNLIGSDSLVTILDHVKNLLNSDNKVIVLYKDSTEIVNSGLNHPNLVLIDCKASDFKWTFDQAVRQLPGSIVIDEEYISKGSVKEKLDVSLSSDYDLTVFNVSKIYEELAKDYSLF